MKRTDKQKERNERMIYRLAWASFIVTVIQTIISLIK